MIKKSLDKIFETSKIKKIKDKKPKKLTKNMKLLMYINDRLNSIKKYPVVVENNAIDSDKEKMIEYLKQNKIDEIIKNYTSRTKKKFKDKINEIFKKGIEEKHFPSDTLSQILINDYFTKSKIDQLIKGIGASQKRRSFDKAISEVFEIQRDIIKRGEYQTKKKKLIAQAQSKEQEEESEEEKE
jgi:hypothetical protein